MTTTTRVDKSSDRVRRMFAQIAPQYDRLNGILSFNIDSSWRRRVVSELKIFPERGPVLDVCTGTGDLALEIARQCRGEIEVVGADFCAPMLEIARQKLAKRIDLRHSVRFVEADTEKLPFDDQAFQAVTVAFGIRNVADTQNGLREMLRVCKTGGQIAVLEFSQPTTPGFKQLNQFYCEWLLPRIGQCLAKNTESAYRYLPESVREFPSGDSMIRLLESIGLCRVRAIPLTFGVATIYVGEKA